MDEKNPRVATKNEGYDGDYCTIIGDTPLLSNAVTSCNVKILKSRYNDGGSIVVGVAPSDIDQNEDDNYENCGWYFDCYDSTLWSGPPHNYSGKEYMKKERKQMLCTHRRHCWRCDGHSKGRTLIYLE